MKTVEELNALKEEVETLNKKLCDLSEEELAQVTGGENEYKICPYCGLYLPPYKPAAIKHLMRHKQNEGGERQ